MPAEMMLETAELQKQFTAARVSGDYATMKVLQKVAARYRADTAKEHAAPAFTRGALKARVGELRKAPMLEPAFRRKARLA